MTVMNSTPRLMPSFLHRHPLALRGAMRIDRAPVWLWVGLQTAALWPVWRWAAACAAGCCPAPLGLLALAAPGALLWRLRGQLRCAPRLAWLAAALAGTLTATLAQGAPPIAGLLAVLAWACGLLAFLPAAAQRGAALIQNSFQNRILGKTLYGAAMLACALRPGL